MPPTDQQIAEWRRLAEGATPNWDGIVILDMRVPRGADEQLAYAARAAVPALCDGIEARDAEIARLRRDCETHREVLEAYKEASGIVKDVAYADSINAALNREAERGAQLAIENERLRVLAASFQSQCFVYAEQYRVWLDERDRLRVGLQTLLNSALPVPVRYDMTAAILAGEDMRDRAVVDQILSGTWKPSDEQCTVLRGELAEAGIDTTAAVEKVLAAVRAAGPQPLPRK